MKLNHNINETIFRVRVLCRSIGQVQVQVLEAFANTRRKPFVCILKSIYVIVLMFKLILYDISNSKHI